MASSTPRHLYDVGLMSELVEDEQVCATGVDGVILFGRLTIIK